MLSFLKKKQTPSDDAVLIADIRALTDMRRFVPYLEMRTSEATSFQAGNVRSAFKGRGMEFEEIRAYNYGDDIRDIDWRVTARKNQPYTKLYAEEKDREIFVWLDLSASMRFGTKNELKTVSAAKTTALIGWLTLARGDRFGLAVFDGTQTAVFQPERSGEHLLHLLKQIETISKRTLDQTTDTITAVQSLNTLLGRLNRRVVLFAIGDFNSQDTALQKILFKASARHDLSVIGLYDALEFDPLPVGSYPTAYQGTHRLIISNGPKFDALYRSFFEAKRQNLKTLCDRTGCRFKAVRTDKPLHKQLNPL